MARLKRIPGSLRDVGYTTLPCDTETKNIIQNLAGDKPVSHWLRDQVKAMSDGSQAEFKMNNNV